uniref:Aa_trans domain-containing protein n=1 Tax=Panagrellus redivivus TaxID=6233 RepID=A0A7E4VHV6_PANRE
MAPGMLINADFNPCFTSCSLVTIKMTIGTYRNRVGSISISESGAKTQTKDDSTSDGSSISGTFSAHHDGQMVDGKFIRNGGLGWFITGLFIIGDLAGGGLVAVPTAMIQLNFYPGLVILFIMNVVTLLTGVTLGLCWNILLRFWPKYRSHCRKPYPEIANMALGPKWKMIVSIIIDLTQFGIAVVYLLLSAKNIHDAIKSFSSFEISFCWVILILAVCLLPIMFLKSPQDFWAAVVVAMVTTATAVVLILVGSIMDYGVCHEQHHMPDFKITNYFLGLGTLLFAYGGHSSLPTVQHDMKQPHEFTKSVVMGFLALFVLYIPVSIMGYLTYGDSLRDSVINSIQNQGIQQTINLLITVHCILTLTIVFNPLNQDIEQLFKVPHRFGIKRVIVRTSVMVAVAFVAESVPTFGPLLDLLGGTTLTLTSILLPVLFYMYLHALENKVKKLKDPEHPTEDDLKTLSFSEMREHLPGWMFIIAALILILGLIGGGAATFSAIRELSTTKFTYPCYVQPFISGAGGNDEHSTNCCGYSFNVSHSGVKCAVWEDSFYK